MLQQYKNWFAYIALMILLTCLIIWGLLLNPQGLPLFLGTTIIALGFVAVMALFPKYRQRLVEKVVMSEYESQKKGGLLYRYGKIFFFVMVITTAVFSLVAVNDPAILDVPYVPNLMFVVFVVFTFSFVAFISGLLKGYGKWGLIIIGIGIVLAVLRLLVRHM